MILQRDPRNPILTRDDVPEVPGTFSDVTSVFNPGAIKMGDSYVLLLRVQTRGRETHLLLAESADGRRFHVSPMAPRISGLERAPQPLYHVYDPRITRIDKDLFVVVAMDTGAGCRLGLLRSTDLLHLEYLGTVSQADERNGVLFPERVQGCYLMLRRPNRPAADGSPRSGDTIELAASDDLLAWRALGAVMEGRPHFWDELIGPGPPPIKTSRGWLLLYHGIATHFHSVNVYQAGVALLDLEDPRRVLARGRENILEPREIYELTGQVPNVVFPAGMIVDEVDDDGCALPASRVWIYYGAADTSVCLATGTVAELVSACGPAAAE